MVTLNNMIKEYVGTTNNTALFREMKLWGDYSKVVSFIRDNRERFEKGMARRFPTEYSKICYFSAIIKNGINDYIPPESEIQKQVNDEFYDCKHKHKERRKCLNDYYAELEDEGI